MLPLPVLYAFLMPLLPIMIPPVGKSGAGMYFIRSSIDMSGLSIKATEASIASPKLCGGMFVAIPTAIPSAPFTRRFGYLAGSTTGCILVSSKFG